MPEIPLELEAIDSKEKRDAVADELSRRFTAWEDHIGGLSSRWDEIEREIRNDPDSGGEEPWPGFIKRHIPVLSAKARAWQAYVCGPPTQASPYLVGTLFGADATRATGVEQDFYLFMKKAGYDRAFRRNVLNVGIYGKAIWRVRPYNHKGKPCFEYAAVSPRNFFIYPNIEDGIEAALNVGHCYEMSVAEIEAMQLSGEFYADSVPTETQRVNKEAPGLTDESKSIAIEPGQKPVRVVECFDKRDLGEGEKLYLVRFCPDNKQLYSVLPYRYSRPWYFDMFIHEEQGRFWPETSRFNDIQDLQKATTEHWNLMNAGMQMGAFPTTYAIGWALPQKYARNKPGTVIPILQGGSVSQVQSRYDPSVAPLLLQDLDKRADLMMRIGAQSQGGEASYDNTATGAQIRKLSVDVAVNDDLANMDVCMGQIGSFMQEVYLEDFQAFRSAYGPNLSVQEPSVLAQEILWEMNGKSPANTPQAQAEQAMAMVSALASFTPDLMTMLQLNGINARELMKTIVSNSSLDNKELILTPEVPNVNGVAGPVAGMPGMEMGAVPGPEVGGDGYGAPA